MELALTLREKHGIPAEIVTADAFQVYTGLDIGTAKPTPAERRGVPHHLIDIVGSPVLRTGSEFTARPGSESRATQPFTLDDWLTLGNRTIADLRARGILPIVVGGTHLYIKALLDGLFDGPEPDHALRAELAAMDPSARRAELERVDPAAADRIHLNDIRRTVRALEVFRLSGKPISAHQTQWDREEGRGPCAVGRGAESAPFPLPTAHCPLPFLLTILDWQTEPLNSRINTRVKQMMANGLLEEVRSLVRSNGFTPQSAEALGYKQLMPIVRGAIEANIWPPPAAAIEEAVERIKIDTRRFAKNQRTWLRRLSITPGSIRLSAPPTPESPRESWVPRILAALKLPS